MDLLSENIKSHSRAAVRFLFRAIMRCTAFRRKALTYKKAAMMVAYRGVSQPNCSFLDFIVLFDNVELFIDSSTIPLFVDTIPSFLKPSAKT